MLRVAVELPYHSALDAPLTYACERTLSAGTLLRVPLGQRQVLGIVWPGEVEADAGAALRPVGSVLDAVPPLPGAWCALVEFAARYYQRSIGELALSVLPAALHRLDAARL